MVKTMVTVSSISFQKGPELRETVGHCCITFQSFQFSLRSQASGNQDHQKSNQSLSKLQFHGKRSFGRLLNHLRHTHSTRRVKLLNPQPCDNGSGGGFVCGQRHAVDVTNAHEGRYVRFMRLSRQWIAKEQNPFDFLFGESTADDQVTPIRPMRD